MSWLPILVSLAMSAGGCARELSLRTPDFKAQNVRIVFMPAMVALYNLEEDGELTFDAGWSKQERVKVNMWLRFLSTTHGFRLADLGEVSGSPPASTTFYDRLDKVTKQVIADGGRRPLSEWSLGDDDGFRGWGPALKADYLGFIAFRGAYETEARRQAGANAILMGGLIGGAAGGVVGAALFARSNDSTLRRGAMVIIDARTNRIVQVRTVAFDQFDNVEIQSNLDKMVSALGS